MSEAELHILNCRMQQGRLNKARRGVLVTHVPLGHIQTASVEDLIDPDRHGSRRITSRLSDI